MYHTFSLQIYRVHTLVAKFHPLSSHSSSMELMAFRQKRLMSKNILKIRTSFWLGIRVRSRPRACLSTCRATWASRRPCLSRERTRYWHCPSTTPSLSRHLQSILDQKSLWISSRTAMASWRRHSTLAWTSVLSRWASCGPAECPWSSRETA